MARQRIDRSRIRTSHAPAAIASYSQAIQVGDTVYCSGQIAQDPETGALVQDSLEAETERVLENLGAVLRAAGLTFNHVVQCTVYLTDINDYGPVNEIYARYFSEFPPARDALGIAALPRGARVEISCIAVR
ncbi:MAG: RidA family protein [Bacteroidota bacterium]